MRVQIRGCATTARTVMTDVSAAAMRWCERGRVAVFMVVDGDGAAGCALQVKVARRRKMVVVEARGCCCANEDGGCSSLLQELAVVRESLRRRSAMEVA